jgi:hypothetical protein
METQALYREFCQQLPDLPVSAQPWYLDAVCEGGQWGAAVVQQDGQAVAALPYFLKRKGPFRYLAMPHFVKHLGPYLLPEYRALKFEHKLYEELIRQLPAVHAIKQDLHPAAANWLPFHWQGFRQTTRYTYQLDLRPGLDAVYDGFNRNMRRNLKKAEAELQVHSNISPEQVYAMAKMSFDRQALSTPFPRALFLKHHDALAAHQACQAFAAQDAQGRLHAAAYLSWDRQSSYYHLAGDDPALRHSGASILLSREAIRYTHEVLGLPTFDFEGSMAPQIEAIRRQFGARQVPYSRVWKYNSRWFAAMDRNKPWR